MGGLMKESPPSWPCPVTLGGSDTLGFVGSGYVQPSLVPSSFTPVDIFGRVYDKARAGAVTRKQERGIGRTSLVE